MNEDADTSLSEFEISFQITGKTILNLECDEGCAWKKLSFECPENKCDVSIDNFGMNMTNETEGRDFIINVQRNNDNINLKCEAGCAWASLDLLEMAPNTTKSIDNFGMATP